MLLSEEEINARYTNPDNLFNRLEALKTQRSGKSLIVSIPPPKAEDLIEDIDNKLSAKNSQQKAIGIIDKCLNKLEQHADLLEVKRLPGIIRDMALTVKNLEADTNKANDNRTQFIVYNPTMLTEDAFDTVIVKET